MVDLARLLVLGVLTRQLVHMMSLQSKHALYTCAEAATPWVENDDIADSLA